MMVVLTESLKQWLVRYHREKLPLIMLGHTEEMTDEMCQEYISWCQSEEGREYLKGGNKYKEPGVG